MKKKKFNNVYVRKFGYFNLYVIRGKNGDILIDTGFIGMKHKIKKWLKQFDVDIKLKDNQIIRRYGVELKIISLPGHTDGSIGILYKDYLFAGDALVNGGNGMEIAFQNQDCNAALLSFDKIKKINPAIIFVGHDKEIINI